jgi:hypothetical protein
MFDFGVSDALAIVAPSTCSASHLINSFAAIFIVEPVVKTHRRAEHFLYFVIQHFYYTRKKKNIGNIYFRSFFR